MSQATDTTEQDQTFDMKQYEVVQKFYYPTEELWYVVKDGKHGVIDFNAGKVIVPVQYNEKPKEVLGAKWFWIVDQKGIYHSGEDGSGKGEFVSNGYLATHQISPMIVGDELGCLMYTKSGELEFLIVWSIKHDIIFHYGAASAQHECFATKFGRSIPFSGDAVDINLTHAKFSGNRFAYSFSGRFGHIPFTPDERGVTSVLSFELSSGKYSVFSIQ